MTKEQEAIEYFEGKILEEGDNITITFDFIENLDTVLNMLKEKDKMIDLLIDKLNQNYSNVFKSNEVKEIIEIYEKIKNISNLSGIELRKECIKQYFKEIAERKSEE